MSTDISRTPAALGAWRRPRSLPGNLGTNVEMACHTVNQSPWIPESIKRAFFQAMEGHTQLPILQMLACSFLSPCLRGLMYPGLAPDLIYLRVT